MNKNIKAIFLDIDGTLVPFGSHSIPEEVKNALGLPARKVLKYLSQPGDIFHGLIISVIQNLTVMSLPMERCACYKTKKAVFSNVA